MNNCLGTMADIFRDNNSEVHVCKQPSLKLNALSNWAPLVVNFVVGLLLTPYLIEHLGRIHYGIWALVGSLLGYYGLLRMGIGAGIMRYVPFYRGTSEQGAASQIASSAVVMFLAVGSVILLISIFLAEPIARFYRGGDQLVTLVRVFGLVAALECPMRVLEACIRSYEHWVAINFVTITKAIVRALGLVACVYFGYGVVEMGYVVLAVRLTSFVSVFILFMRFCPDIQLRPSMVKLTRIRALISFGILSAIITLAYTLTLQGHCLIIGKVISLKAVTIYAVPMLLIQNIRRGLLAPARVLWPRFAYLDGKNLSDKVASLFLRGTRLTSILASGVMFVVFVLGPSFIGLWMEGDFTAAYPVLLLLAGGYLVEGSQAILPFLMGATGHQGKQAIFAGVEGVIGIGLSIILTERFGLVGAALGFVIAIVLIRGIVGPWYICHVLGISLSKYYTTKLLRPWLILLVLALAMYGLDLPSYVHGWSSWVGFAALMCSLYTVCVYMVVLNDGEREWVRSCARKLCRPAMNPKHTDGRRW